MLLMGQIGCVAMGIMTQQLSILIVSMWSAATAAVMLTVWLWKINLTVRRMDNGYNYRTVEESTATVSHHIWPVSITSHRHVVQWQIVALNRRRNIIRLLCITNNILLEYILKDQFNWISIDGLYGYGPSIVRYRNASALLKCSIYSQFKRHETFASEKLNVLVKSIDVLE